MAINQKQIYDLNNMNVAAQNVAMGTLINSLGSMAAEDTNNVGITGGDISGVNLSGVTISGSITIGTEEGYTLFEEDGTIIFSGSATVWDDIFFPLVTAKQGQTDKPAFSTSEIAYLFPQADTSASMLIVAQFPHTYKRGSDIGPHVHWKQTQSGSVVYKMAYKWFPIGGQIPDSWETHTMATPAIPYTSGSIHQLNYGNKISGSMLESTETGVSSIMLIKLYRDDNTYTGNAVTYQFDIHFLKDSIGSRNEFIK